MSSRAWRTQRGARGLLAVAVLVLAVVTPHTIAGAGIDREAARSRALQFARSKFEYVVANMRVADPLYDVIRAGFCRGAHELDVADVCGRGSPTSRVFVVDVLSVSHTRIIDVVAVSDTSTYSLREPAGFQRWVSEEGAVCTDPHDLLALALLHMRVVYATEDVPSKDLQLCEWLGELRSGAPLCVVPNVESDEIGMRIKFVVATAGPGFHTLRLGQAPDLWEAELTWTGRYQASRGSASTGLGGRAGAGTGDSK